MINFTCFCTISLNLKFISLTSHGKLFLVLYQAKKTAMYLKLFWFKLFAHSKLKLLDFLWDFVLYYYRRPKINFPVLETFVCSRQILFLLILNRSPEQQHEPVLQLYVNI